ncbi:MAG: cysteine--tRNA ligase [Clostridiales bacterium]|nr:cysteine--tRNA ligase [Clostridiales bacterium]
MKLYNSKSRHKEDFSPLIEGKAGIYCCGPTVYNYIHLGNARPLVVFDTIRRYLLWRGFDVTFVQNFTDVEDKIIQRAAEEGLSTEAFTEKYIAAYFEDTKTLNVLPADKHPRVSRHMPEIINMIKAILAHGHAYEAAGDVYFDVRSFPAYGELSGRDIDDMRSGARVLPGEAKRDPLDFALWKAAKPGEPAWDSPWGLGRPGWHIECSAMSCKYLGTDFDIHGGGADLIFPHHENEIAQSLAANGAGFARYWLHNGFITVDQEKMSKSLGNFFLLREILAKFPGDIIRFYLLSTHYRSPLDFADDKLAVAAKSLERIRNSLRLLEEAKTRASINPARLTQCCQTAREGFIAAMDDDFNTALAISTIFTFCHELNSYLNGENPPTLADIETAEQLFTDFEAVLGMIKPTAKESGGLEEPLLELLLKVREQARVKKDWAAADAIRDGLKEIGIAIEDTPQGARWKKD